MSVRAVSLFQPRDGKREDSLKEASQANEHLTRFGARFRLGEMVFDGVVRRKAETARPSPQPARVRASTSPCNLHRQLQRWMHAR